MINPARLGIHRLQPEGAPLLISLIKEIVINFSLIHIDSHHLRILLMAALKK